MVLHFFSISSGEGIHWFVICQTSKSTVEIFDSLGTSAEYIKNKIPLQGIFEFNTFPVQCRDSYYCGAFVIYYIIERYSNLDLEFEDLLNDIFTPSCNKNQEKVKAFLKTLDYVLK